MKEGITTPRAVNLKEGEKRIDKYIFSLNQVIGKGSYATVYLGRRIPDDIPTAVKVIDKKIFANTYNIKSIQSEIEIMKKVEHTNIVKLLDVYQTNNNMYIVTEFCQDGDLRGYIKKKKRLGESGAVEALKDIVAGFKYLHEREIIHRDLKPANILISEGTCKISDFGFAKSLEYGEGTVLKSIVGTPLYMSPQILNK